VQLAGKSLQGIVENESVWRARPLWSCLPSKHTADSNNDGTRVVVGSTSLYPELSAQYIFGESAGMADEASM
jgi:hypothetical protein